MATPPPLDPGRVCVRGGFLVGPAALLPKDDRYFQTPGAKFLVGCNQFQCRLCGHKVRTLAGLRDADPAVAAAHFREIFETPDLSQSPYLVADANSRLYSCACSLVTLEGAKTFPFPNENWGCAGHPPMDNGTVLPPITVDTAKNFVVAIANANFQQAVKAVAVTYTDGQGLVSLPAHMSLGADMPALKLWINDEAMELNFAEVAGGCLQTEDGVISAF